MSDNIFSSNNALDMLSMPKVSAIAGLTSSLGTSLLTNGPAGTNSNGNKGAITQTERLFTTRSRGINKIDERGEHAYIKLMTTDPSTSLDRHSGGANVQPTSLGTSTSGVLNDAINGSKGYADFLLMDVQCSLEEKLQVIEVFGDAEVSYYFGRQPITFNFSGLLIDSPDNNWFIQWIEMYTHVLRGSQLARNYELVKIVLPNMTIIGTINRMSWNQTSARDTDIPFQFSFLAKQIIPQPVTLPNVPLTPHDTSINWDTVKNFIPKSQKDINTMKNSVSTLQSIIMDPTSTTKDFGQALSAFGQSSVASPNGFDFSSLDSTVSNVTNVTSGVDSLGNAFGGITPVGGPTTTSASSSNDLFAGSSTNLSGIRASLFSPVYGVLSSLTKLIKGVTGNLNSVIHSFTSPVRDILRDVRNISNQAIGVVNLINNSIHGVTNQINSFDREIFSTLNLLKKTAGVITNAPQTIGSSMRDLVSAGRFPLTTKFLQSGGNTVSINSGTHINSKVALLNSGPKHTPQQGAKL